MFHEPLPFTSKVPSESLAPGFMQGLSLSVKGLEESLGVVSTIYLYLYLYLYMSAIIIIVVVVTDIFKESQCVCTEQPALHQALHKTPRMQREGRYSASSGDLHFWASMIYLPH